MSLKVFLSKKERRRVGFFVSGLLPYFNRFNVFFWFSVGKCEEVINWLPL